MRFLTSLIMTALLSSTSIPIAGAEELSIDPPSGWECIQDATQLPKTVRLVYIGAEKGTFTPSINIAAEETTMHIEEYVILAKSYHESEGDTRCSRMGTLETNEGTAHLLQIERPSQWGIIRFIQAILIKNGTAYLITATCLQNEFNSFSSKFFNSIRSFTVQEER